RQLNHEIDELDELRVAALDGPTARRLEESQVHVDLISGRASAQATLGAIEDYVGGRDHLRGLNFLLPGRAGFHDDLERALGDAGARADAAPPTRRASQTQKLTKAHAMLAGGGIDCAAFTGPGNVQALAKLFDTNDLSPRPPGVMVACFDRHTALA